MMVLAEGLEFADSMDVNDVKEKILSIGTFDGLQSDVELNEYGDSIRPFFKFQVQDGAFKRVK